jgi:hypothetical protein
MTSMATAAHLRSQEPNDCPRQVWAPLPRAPPSAACRCHGTKTVLSIERMETAAHLRSRRPDRSPPHPCAPVPLLPLSRLRTSRRNMSTHTLCDTCKVLRTCGPEHEVTLLLSFAPLCCRHRQPLANVAARRARPAVAHRGDAAAVPHAHACPVERLLRRVRERVRVALHSTSSHLNAVHIGCHEFEAAAVPRRARRHGCAPAATSARARRVTLQERRAAWRKACRCAGTGARAALHAWPRCAAPAAARTLRLSWYSLCTRVQAILQARLRLW